MHKIVLVARSIDICPPREQYRYHRALLGRYAEAEGLVRETFDAQQRVFGEHHLQTLEKRTTLVQLLIFQEKFAAALAEYDKLLPVLTRVLGPDHRLSLILREFNSQIR